jgi:diguanylate cyclase (GGDEF)-like protein
VGGHIDASATEHGDQTQRLVSETLRQLGTVLPSPGALLDLITGPHGDANYVTRTLRASPALSARVLGAVNSAAVGISREIRSIDRAVLLLGASRARSVAMAYGLRLLVENCRLPKDLVETLWTNSLRKACAARRFCAIVDGSKADIAYSLALVQDIGLPMLMAVDPDFYQTKMKPVVDGPSWSDLERQRFGISHEAVGQGLLMEWHASKVLQQSVLRHHRAPDHHGGDENALLDLSIFYASLMPHLYEDFESGQREWVHAIFAKFLGAHFASPDDFFEAAALDARQTVGRTNDLTREERKHLMASLVGELTTDTCKLVTHLSHLEATMHRTQADFNDLRTQAFTDSLTKTLNRRGFMQLAERRLKVAAQNGMSLACMLLDMDGFKQINDTYGHEAGDRCLRGLSRIIRHCLDRQDMIGRLGGDEFAIMLIDIEESQARAVGERLCQMVKRTPVPIAEDVDIDIQFSLGVVYARKMPLGTNIDDVIRAADHAMYEKKKGSKGGMIFVPFELPSNDKPHLPGDESDIAV